MSSPILNPQNFELALPVLLALPATLPSCPACPAGPTYCPAYYAVTSCLHCLLCLPCWHAPASRVCCEHIDIVCTPNQVLHVEQNDESRHSIMCSMHELPGIECKHYFMFGAHNLKMHT